MQAELYQSDYESPIGLIRIVADRTLVHSVSFAEPKTRRFILETNDCLQEVKTQLECYFKDPKFQFNLPLKPVHTVFQQQVLSALMEIPAGQILNYKAMACRLGRPSAARAVGHALSKNPFLVVVPCHRVVGSSGQLTGYAGGIERKKWLLEFETQNLLQNYSESR